MEAGQVRPVPEVDHRCDKQGRQCRPAPPREHRGRDDHGAAGEYQEAWQAEQPDAAVVDAMNPVRDRDLENVCQHQEQRGQQGERRQRGRPAATRAAQPHEQRSPDDVGDIARGGPRLPNPG